MRLPDITIWKEKEFMWPPYVFKGENTDALAIENDGFDKFWTFNIFFWQLELVWWVNEANT